MRYFWLKMAWGVVLLLLVVVVGVFLWAGDAGVEVFFEHDFFLLRLRRFRVVDLFAARRVLWLFIDDLAFEEAFREHA